MADKYVSNDPTETVVQRDGMPNALVILTTLFLLGGVYCVEKAKQKHFDTGMFGQTKGAPNVPALTDKAIQALREAPK
jgi:hypothetical protein